MQTPTRNLPRRPLVTTREARSRAAGSERGRKSKYWCFTINNYDEDDIHVLRNIMDSGLITTYVVFGRELSQSGTPHIQGYMELKSRWDLKRLKRSFFNTAHFEARRGTPEEAAEYCKKDGDWEESGTRSSGIKGMLFTGPRINLIS